MAERLNFVRSIRMSIRDFQQRRAEARDLRLVASAQSWYETCRQVSETCGKALFNVKDIPEDVGEVLDRVDRTLFKLRDDASDTFKGVKFHDRELASRIEQVTQLVFRLRNQTMSFLLRAQGPDVFASSRAEAQSQRHWYYLRALEEAGFSARDIKKKLDTEIKALWNELELLLRELQHAPGFAQ